MNPPPGIEALPNGQWVISQDSHLSAWAKQHGSIVTDPWLFLWLKPHLDGVKVVFDIGANIGDHVRWYLDQGYEVVAFEPNPLAHQCLVHNCPESRNIMVAASDVNGVANFTQLENVGASKITENGELRVITVALDTLVTLPAPDFVKIDVEGYEAFAITGMAGTITHHKPIILCEMNAGALAAHKHSVEGLRGLIESLGYVAEALYPPEATWSDLQFDCLFTPIEITEE